MASIRGYKKGIKDPELRKFIDNYTARVITAATTAGKESMKELRESIVKKWYNSEESRAKHMKAATRYEAESPKKTGHIYEITITSYVDPVLYERSKESSSSRNWFSSPYESVKRWRERHEIGNRGSDGKRGGTGHWTYYDRNPSEKNPLRDVMPMPYTIGEYLFNLPWEEGIFGLPPEARHTKTGWKNPAKNTVNQHGSLESYINKNLTERKWKQTVQKKFDEIL